MRKVTGSVFDSAFASDDNPGGELAEGIHVVRINATKLRGQQTWFTCDLIRKQRDCGPSPFEDLQLLYDAPLADKESISFSPGSWDDRSPHPRED